MLLCNGSSGLKTKKKKKRKVSVPVTFPFSDQDPTLFNTFCVLCASLRAEPKQKKKSEILSNYLTKFERNEELATVAVRMLLPKADRIYSLKPVSLMKIFSKIFNTSTSSLKNEFRQIRDVSIVIGNAYSAANKEHLEKPPISLSEMDDMLFELNIKTEKKEQLRVVKRILNKLRFREEVVNFIRLVVGDLKTKADDKHIFDAVGFGAYDAFCTSRDIKEAVSIGRQSSSSVTIAPRVLVPVMPMLARKSSVAAAVKMVSNGRLYSEIKYDGERVQVHKKGNRFAFFSRTLQPVADHKVEDMKEYVVEAFPEAESIILDVEVLMVCKKTGKPLPFGENKRKHIADSANICLFVFDVLLYNGENMLNKPLSDRRALLERVMTEQRNRVVLSELTKIENGKKDLDSMLQRGSGLILKDIEGQYEPGKRRWLEIKRAMADTVNLVVLGAWHGKEGLLSTFLMGCLDKRTGEWKTVTKAQFDLDERLEDEIKAIMVKSGEEEKSFKLIMTTKPDYIVKDPKKAPVWELAGAWLTKDVNNGSISIRYPRITKERKDKNWETAINMEELEELYEASVTATKPPKIVVMATSELKRAREGEKGSVLLHSKRKCLK